MTSSRGHIFRVTGPLWGESTGQRWFALTKASDAELWYFLWCAKKKTPEQAVQMSVICTPWRSLWRNFNDPSGFLQWRLEIWHYQSNPMLQESTNFWQPQQNPVHIMDCNTYQHIYIFGMIRGKPWIFWCHSYSTRNAPGVCIWVLLDVTAFGLVTHNRSGICLNKHTEACNDTRSYSSMMIMV